MEYNVEISDLAKVDINTIINYIFKISFSINISKKIYDEIYSAIFSLNLLPFRYPVFKNELRVMTINGRYRVFYEIDNINKIVIIYRVFASKQDYNSYI